MAYNYNDTININSLVKSDHITSLRNNCENYYEYYNKFTYGGRFNLITNDTIGYYPHINNIVTLFDINKNIWRPISFTNINIISTELPIANKIYNIFFHIENNNIVKTITDTALVYNEYKILVNSQETYKVYMGSAYKNTNNNFVNSINECSFVNAFNESPRVLKTFEYNIIVPVGSDNWAYISNNSYMRYLHQPKFGDTFYSFNAMIYNNNVLATIGSALVVDNSIISNRPNNIPVNLLNQSNSSYNIHLSLNTVYVSNYNDDYIQPNIRTIYGCCAQTSLNYYTLNYYEMSLKLKN